MKTLILLPLFALLPFLAFPNGTPEIPKEEKGNKVELTDSQTTEMRDDDYSCTVSVSHTYRSPIGEIKIICTSKANTCKEAREKAYECIGKNYIDINP